MVLNFLPFLPWGKNPQSPDHLDFALIFGFVVKFKIG